MTIENGRQPGSDDIADQQTAAAGGIEAVEDYEDAAGEARGEDPRAAPRASQGDDDDFEDETVLEDEDEDEVDLDEEDDDEDDLDEDDDLEDDDDDLDDDVDEDDLDDGDDTAIDDDGNPLSR